MTSLDLSASTVDSIAPSQAQAETTTTRCPKCGRKIDSLLCGHCGSRLPAEQADLFGAVVKKLLKVGGNRTDATNKGGIPDDNPAADDPSKDPGGASTPQWLFDHCNRLQAAAITVETTTHTTRRSG